MNDTRRWKYALKNGVLQWGLPTAIVFAVTMIGITDTPFFIQLPVAIVGFGLGGLVLGLCVWTPPADEKAEHARGTETTGPATVRNTVLAGILWFDIAVFGSMFLLAVFLEGVFLDLAFGAITLGCVIGLSYVPGVTISGEGVELHNHWRRYFVRWSDVKSYEVDHKGTSYALLTADGQLPLPSLGTWSGKDKHRARSLFRQKLEAHGIPGKSTERVQFRFRPRGIAPA